MESWLAVEEYSRWKTVKVIYDDGGGVIKMKKLRSGNTRVEFRMEGMGECFGIIIRMQ